MFRKLVSMTLLCIGMSISPNDSNNWAALVEEAQQILAEGELYIEPKNGERYGPEDLKFKIVEFHLLPDKRNLSSENIICELDADEFQECIAEFSDVDSFLDQYQSDDKSKIQIIPSFSCRHIDDILSKDLHRLRDIIISLSEILDECFVKARLSDNS